MGVIELANRSSGQAKPVRYNAGVPPVRIELLGNLRVTFGPILLTSVNTSRLQSLLALLVLHGGTVQSREHLAFVLWPESSGSQARTNLRQLLHQLRRALPPECSLLAIDNHTVCWRLDSACSVDVMEFETAAARAANAEKRGALTAAREALEEAVRVYRDDLLPGLYDQWLQPKRAQLQQQLAEVLNRLAALLERTGDYPAAILHATKLVSLDPLREPSYQMLMRLHSRSNDRTSAIRVYHQCKSVLRRELGVSPSQTTQDLFNHALKPEHPHAAVLELPPYARTAPPAMVGRTAEWEHLLGCWRQAIRGDTHFALILGEPGIGKSRLADELFRHCVREAEGGVARARCYFAQGRLAYGPVVEWLRADSMRLAREQLPKQQLAELARVLPEILIDRPEIAPPQPLTESWQRRHFYEALNAGFCKRPRPVLLLIDDLQWCDPDSFEWLHFFFRSEASASTLVVATVRPEGMGRDHPLAGLVGELRQSGQVSEFPLASLSVEETAALAAQVAGRECESGFVSGLYQTTKGNPLFVVESVRSSVEEQSASKNRVPPRVQAVIAARMAQLSRPAFETAGIAAVVGRPFSLALLAKATDLDEDSLSRALEELWQRRIIDGQGAATYDYTHDLLREVAYTELSPVRRRSLHKRVAAALEELNAQDLEPVLGWLAAHYDAAGLAEQAIRNYRAAASVAKNRFAEAEAADLLRNALRLCRDFPVTAKRDEQELELLATLGPSCVVTQGYSSPEVGETYVRGLQLAKQSAGRKHLFSMLSGAWTFHLVRGQLEESRRLAQDWVDNAPHDDMPAVEMTGRFLLGTSLFHQGQLARSREQIEQAVPALTRPSHPALALFAAGPNLGVFCKAYLSHVLWQLGDAGLARARSEEAIGLARELSDPFSLAFGLDYTAMLDVFRRDAESALAHAAEASGICSRYGFTYYLAWADILAGWATAVEDDPAAGLSRLHAGLVALKATGAELRLPFYHGLVAEACGLAGQTDEALANIESALALQNKNREMWFGPELHRIQGDVLTRIGDASGANLSYQSAVQAARQIGSKAAEQRAAERFPNAWYGTVDITGRRALTAVRRGCTRKGTANLRLFKGDSHEVNMSTAIVSNDSLNPSDYVLATGARAVGRLLMLDDIYAPAGKRGLLKAGLKPGMHVADFGCGVGAMTRNLAEMVGPNGRATGIDLHEPQLVEAANLCASCSLSNVSFCKADACDTRLSDNMFDLVYCRFLLIHLPDPVACLREMKRVLKPGGIIFAEDGDLRSGGSAPSSALDHFGGLFERLGPRKGVDYRLGRDLYQLTKRADFENVEVDIYQPAYSRGRERVFLKWSIEEAGQGLIGAGLLTSSELEDILHQMQTASDNPDVLVLMPRMSQVWGWKSM